MTHSDVLEGAERTDLYYPVIRNKRVGLLTNQSGRIDRTPLLDTLLLDGINIVRLFTPEHGYTGLHPDGSVISDSAISPSIPLVSLYGKKKKLTAEDLDQIDVLVFDLQDVGTRFYTYLSTMHLVMEACSENQVPLIILDRPNPNGYYVDGPVLEKEFQSFVGMHEIPIVHGMTLGEIAGMIHGESWLEALASLDLTVIPCSNYDHCSTYILPVKPSPNLPNHRSILLYPSLCLLEGSTVSIGRGTDMQFQVYGHPDFPDSSFTFTPQKNEGSKWPKWEGQKCNGVDLTELGVEEIIQSKQIRLNYLIDAYRNLDNSAFFREDGYFNKLAGTDKLAAQLERGVSERDIRQSWEDGLKEFERIRSKYLIY